MPQNHYDYIIAGGGGAGLSLVFHLLQTRLRDRTILIIDKEDKQQNDRTWCFWEREAGPFEEIVHYQWQHMYFHGKAYSELLNLHPYLYKMIRSQDFYSYVKQRIAAFSTVHWLSAEVQAMEETTSGVRVTTSEGVYTADWVFSSLRDPDERHRAIGHNYLLQHFKGWVIQTPEDFFDPQQATLMDFRIDQHNECRFFYVLPTDKRSALVEFTLFSAELLPEQAYEDELKNYLRDFLSLDAYTIAHEEFGIIPMTDMPYPAQHSAHIVNIGTAGGMTKPSTGYTFQRIQKDCQQLVGAILRTGKPQRTTTFLNRRFQLYDSTLLHVMQQKEYLARDIFTDIFRKNPVERVLRFLSDETTLREEIGVATSVKRGKFVRGMWQAIVS